MRILRPIVFSQALLMVAGKSETPEGSAVERNLSVVTLVGAKPCLRSNLRISLTAADRSRRRWTRISRLHPRGRRHATDTCARPRSGRPFRRDASDRSVADGTVAGAERSPVRI